MAISESRARATKKYQAKFDRIYIRVTAEEKATIESHAEKHGESVNTFVRRVIADAIAGETNEESDNK